MRVTKMLAVATILSMALTPAVAGPANPAASLSLAGADGAAAQVGPTVKSRDTPYLLIGVGAVAVVVLAVAMGHNDSTPASA
jgi:hypothetical protein